MAYKQPGATLQSYNTQLVQTLNELKQQRENLHNKITDAQTEKANLEQRAKALTDELSELNGKFYTETLSQKQYTRGIYQKSIQDTEAQYLAILESSQSLMSLMKK